MIGSLEGDALVEASGRRARALLPQRLRGDRVLMTLLGVVIAVKVVAFLAVAGADLVGDEAAYVDGGRTLSNLLRDLAGFHGPDGAELARGLVASGWFMPGMSVVLTPLFVVVPDSPVWVVRGYLGLVSSGLLLWAVVDVRRTFGRFAAGALLVVPGMVPMAAIFGVSAWGDSSAGLVIVLMVCAVVRLLRTVAAGTGPSRRDGVVLGLLAIAAVYLRSSVSLLTGGLLVATLLLGLVLASRELRLPVLGAMGAAFLTFVVVLAPWSAYASHVLGGRVITTTTVPTVLANTFGDREQVCFGPCDPGSSMWFSPLRYGRELGRATGASEVEALRQMSEYARRDVTPGSYADDVVANTRAYVRDPGRFAYFVRWDAAPAGVVTAVRTMTALMVLPMYAVGVAVLFLVVRRGRDRQVTSIVLKLAIGALLVQPFVHISGSRYWTTLAPLLALGLALLCRADPGPEASRRTSRTLVVAQQALAVGAAAVVLGVMGLSAFG